MRAYGTCGLVGLRACGTFEGLLRLRLALVVELRPDPAFLLCALSGLDRIPLPAAQALPRPFPTGHANEGDRATWIAPSLAVPCRAPPGPCPGAPNGLRRNRVGSVGTASEARSSPEARLRVRSGCAWGTSGARSGHVRSSPLFSEARRLRCEGHRARYGNKIAKKLPYFTVTYKLRASFRPNGKKSGSFTIYSTEIPCFGP